MRRTAACALPTAAARARAPLTATFLPRAHIRPADGKEPEYGPESAYPPWLFELLADKPILEDHLLKGLENVPKQDMKTVVRMINKARIKACVAAAA